MSTQSLAAQGTGLVREVNVAELQAKLRAQKMWRSEFGP